MVRVAFSRSCGVPGGMAQTTLPEEKFTLGARPSQAGH
jgi:hypothetical protein